MSMGIMWEPTNKGERLVTGAASRMWAILREVTMSCECDALTLRQNHVPALRALARADPAEDAYNILANAIEDVGEIRVYTEA